MGANRLFDGLAEVKVLKISSRTYGFLMVCGFRTSGGSIYVMDPEGRTSRFKRSVGRGQGEWHDVAHCVFAAPVTSPIDIYGPDQRIDLVYAKADGTAERLPFKKEVCLPRPGSCDRVAILVQNRATGKYGNQIAATAQPRIGLTPVEKSYTADGFSSTHIGHPVVQVFESVSELRDACLAGGLTTIPLPPQYAEPWRQATLANPAPATQAIPTARTPTQTAKQNFAAQQVKTAPGNTGKEAVTPAIFKVRPQTRFSIGK